MRNQQAGADLSVYRFIGLSAQAGKNRPCHHAAMFCDTITPLQTCWVLPCSPVTQVLPRRWGGGADAFVCTPCGFVVRGVIFCFFFSWVEIVRYRLVKGGRSGDTLVSLYLLYPLYLLHRLYLLFVFVVFAAESDWTIGRPLRTLRSVSQVDWLFTIAILGNKTSDHSKWWKWRTVFAPWFVLCTFE